MYSQTVIIVIIIIIIVILFGYVSKRIYDGITGGVLTGEKKGLINKYQDVFGIGLKSLPEAELEKYAGFLDAIERWKKTNQTGKINRAEFVRRVGSLNVVVEGLDEFNERETWQAKQELRTLIENNR